MDTSKEPTTFAEIKPKMEEEVKKIIETLLKSKTYNQKESDRWVESITKDIIVKSKEVSQAYKYVATCTILEKKDSGLSISSSCFWDSSKDGNVTASWQNDTVLCVANLYIMAL